MNKKWLIDSLIAEREIPVEFSPKSIKVAEEIEMNVSINKEERVDISDKNLVTIDGEFAHDFDDAVECHLNEDGTFMLTVAIADVSTYVSKGSELDNIAKERGNSVYLPDRVIPMLPFKLSNDVCSLTPQQPKNCVVCEMQLDDGIVKSYRFYLGLMVSSRRFTYDECQKIIDQKSDDFPMVHDLTKATMALRDRRLQAGGMLLNKPEKSCRLHKNKVIFEIKLRTTAHLVIEEAMIAANRCAGHFLMYKKYPALYRIHQAPKADKLQQLNDLISNLNYKLPDSPVAADFSELIDNIEQDNPALADALLPCILGTLSRANFSPRHDVGHYGLASDCYLYFTSPIRRYADLINHRAIVAVLHGAQPPYTIEELSAIGEHCSTTEIRADKAEWDSRQRLLCSQAENLVGCTFEGFASGVGARGIFVAISDLNLDGMIRLSSLPGYWEQEGSFPKMTRVSDGESICLGDPLTVKILAVDAEKGQVNLKLTDK